MNYEIITFYRCLTCMTIHESAEMALHCCPTKDIIDFIEGRDDEYD